MTTHRAPSWPTAREAARCPEPLAPTRSELADADRQVLAEPALAQTDLPAYDTSAMDGWAVSGPGPWQVIGSVLAGRAPELVLDRGQACLIATGAAVPDGATGVVRREHGQIVEQALQAPDPAPGTDIRPRGEECRAGDLLAEAGTRLGPGHLGMLAAAGLDSVLVRRAPRVSIVLFGDELVRHGVAGTGQVRDALGPQLPGWLRRLGAEPAEVRFAEDTLEAHVSAIEAASAASDVVITTGGTAAGPVDHLHPAVAALGGAFVVDAVAVRPGHPMTLADLGAHRRGRWLLGLPGNPQSAVVALLTLGQPLIDALLGVPAAPLTTITLAEQAPAPASEHRLLACIRTDDQATPVAHLGSAMLRGLARADGFAVLPPGGAVAGARVGWLPLPA